MKLLCSFGNRYIKMKQPSKQGWLAQPYTTPETRIPYCPLTALTASVPLSHRTANKCTIVRLNITQPNSSLRKSSERKLRNTSGSSGSSQNVTKIWKISFCLAAGKYHHSNDFRPKVSIHLRKKGGSCSVWEAGSHNWVSPQTFSSRDCSDAFTSTCGTAVNCACGVVEWTQCRRGLCWFIPTHFWWGRFTLW